MLPFPAQDAPNKWAITPCLLCRYHWKTIPSGEHSGFEFRVRIVCARPATMARRKPNQPPQRASHAKQSHSQGEVDKQALQPPQPLGGTQPSLGENANFQGTMQAQPPQPPLGSASEQDKDKQKVKPRRRRRCRKGKKLSRTAPSTRDGDSEECGRADTEVNSQSSKPSKSSKRLRVDSPPLQGEECGQAEVKSQGKRLRTVSPQVLDRDGERDGENDLEEIVPLRPIKPKNIPFRRSSTPLFPRQSIRRPSGFRASKSFSKPSNSRTSSRSKELRSKELRSKELLAAYRLQRSKTHRANLKAKRDFPYTLEALACCPNSDTDSEYTPSSRVDSIPTSGQSTPEAPPEPLSVPYEDLFGLQAKPSSPVPSTPTTWSLSSDSASSGTLSDSDYVA